MKKGYKDVSAIVFASDDIEIKDRGRVAVESQLPKIATELEPGLVKPDGATLEINDEGQMSVIGEEAGVVVSSGIVTKQGVQSLEARLVGDTTSKFYLALFEDVKQANGSSLTDIIPGVYDADTNTTTYSKTLGLFKNNVGDLTTLFGASLSTTLNLQEYKTNPGLYDRGDVFVRASESMSGQVILDSKTMTLNDKGEVKSKGVQTVSLGVPQRRLRLGPDDQGNLIIPYAGQVVEENHVNISNYSSTYTQGFSIVADSTTPDESDPLIFYLDFSKHMPPNVNCVTKWTIQTAGRAAYSPLFVIYIDDYMTHVNIASFKMAIDYENQQQVKGAPIMYKGISIGQLTLSLNGEGAEGLAGLPDLFSQFTMPCILGKEISGHIGDSALKSYWSGYSPGTIGMIDPDAYTDLEEGVKKNVVNSINLIDRDLYTIIKDNKSQFTIPEATLGAESQNNISLILFTGDFIRLIGVDLTTVRAGRLEFLNQFATTIDDPLAVNALFTVGPVTATSVKLKINDNATGRVIIEKTFTNADSGEFGYYVREDRNWQVKINCNYATNLFTIGLGSVGNYVYMGTPYYFTNSPILTVLDGELTERPGLIWSSDLEDVRKESVSRDSSNAKGFVQVKDSTDDVPYRTVIASETTNELLGASAVKSTSVEFRPSGLKIKRDGANKGKTRFELNDDDVLTKGEIDDQLINIATTTTPGIVKPDGTTISVAADGKISTVTQPVPVDDVTIKVTDGKLSVPIDDDTIKVVDGKITAIDNEWVKFEMTAENASPSDPKLVHSYFKIKPKSRQSYGIYTIIKYEIPNSRDIAVPTVIEFKNTQRVCTLLNAYRMDQEADGEWVFFPNSELHDETNYAYVKKTDIDSGLFTYIAEDYTFYAEEVLYNRPIYNLGNYVDDETIIYENSHLKAIIPPETPPDDDTIKVIDGKLTVQKRALVDNSTLVVEEGHMSVQVDQKTVVVSREGLNVWTPNLADDETIITENLKLKVPIDNDTIRVVDGKLTVKGYVEGYGKANIGLFNRTGTLETPAGSQFLNIFIQKREGNTYASITGEDGGNDYPRVFINSSSIMGSSQAIFEPHRISFICLANGGYTAGVYLYAPSFNWATTDTDDLKQLVTAGDIKTYVQNQLNSFYDKTTLIDNGANDPEDKEEKQTLLKMIKEMQTEINELKKQIKCLSK